MLNDDDAANDNVDDFEHAYRLAWKHVYASGHVKRFEVGRLLAKACGFWEYHDMCRNHTKKTVKKLKTLNSEHAYTLCQVMLARQSK